MADGDLTMTDLRTAAQQALGALGLWATGRDMDAVKLNDLIHGLEAALYAVLAEPEGGGNLPPPLPGDFDHAIGADRFKVVRGAFWWHVLIGDSPTKHGKFHSRASAEKMAAVLLREFRNGAFVQHEAALAEPVQEPVAWLSRDDARLALWEAINKREFGNPTDDKLILDHLHQQGLWIGKYTAPPQRKPLSEDEQVNLAREMVKGNKSVEWLVRAVEKVHGIGDGIKTS